MPAKKKHARTKFTVSFLLPRGASAGDARDYILNAVIAWRGQCRPPGAYNDHDPGDPMCDLDRDSVRVSQQRKNSRERA